MSHRYRHLVDTLPNLCCCRYMVGIAGVPGSGKSTLAKEVCARINALAGCPIAAQVPMDGFHYYRRQLDAMPNPGEAHARRGAHWTFDADAYLHCLETIRKAGEATVLAASFDHGVGDPVPDNITVGPQHGIVLSEGNYLLLEMEPWAQLAQRVFDDTWFVECEVDEAMTRVFERQTGHGVAAEVSQRRIATNDRPNARQIMLTKHRAKILVPSLPFCKRK
jgi:pantothenate kinase